MAAIGGIAACAAVSAQTFVTIKDPECLNSVSGLFTEGGNYTQPYNGVIDDSWSMLMRWQGSGWPSQSVSYDLSNSTRMNYSDTGIFGGQASTVGSYSTWQRGYQTENSTNRTPGTQLYCNMGGFLINTNSVTHISIPGGGYNDMFGYSWSAPYRPMAFLYGGTIATDLVVQADIAVPYVKFTKTSSLQDPEMQFSIFAYVL